jgi:hypothetical protein
MLMDELNLAQELSDTKYGVQLRKNEIFGRVQDYKPPKNRGSYRLQAELGQVGFLTDQQKEALSQHQIRILHHTRVAQVATAPLSPFPVHPELRRGPPFAAPSNRLKTQPL